MTLSTLLGPWLRRNRFLPVLAALLAIELAFVRATDWAAPGPAEAAILFDLCLFIPALFLLCYRRRLARRALLVRAGALCCLGMWTAGALIPPEAHHLLGELGWVRTAGLAVLALVELSLALVALRLVLGGRAQAEEIAERTGAPRWIARLMLLEARFWKWLWRTMRGS